MGHLNVIFNHAVFGKSSFLLYMSDHKAKEFQNTSD